MKVSEKAIGIVVLVAFTLMAGSVICFASGQANMMDTCGNGGVSGAMCPFMSVSVSAVANTSPATRIFGLVAALLLVVGFVFKFSSENGYANKLVALSGDGVHERRDLAIGRRSDTILNLISDGVLHSRVFGY